MKMFDIYLIFCVLIICLTAAASAATEFAVDPSIDAQSSPDIDGSVVVWAEYMSEYGDYDIVGIDLESDFGYIYIVGRAYDQTHPVVSGQRVVWQDDVNGDGSNYNIQLSDISNPSGILSYPVAATGDAEINPTVHGEAVIWQVNYGIAENLDWNIQGADMADPNLPLIYEVDTFGNNQTNPALYRNRVVYQDDTGVHQDIWSADVWMKTNPSYQAVVTDQAEELNQIVPAVWDDIVAYEQQTVAGNSDIFVADMSGPQITPVCNHPANQTAPDIWGHIVVWQDNRNDNWDIYGYNLITQKEFRITDDPADQTAPAVSGNTVVWEDMRDDIPTIWAVYLDAVDIADCPVPPEGDTDGNCRVNLADFMNVAQNWLACDLVPLDACSN